MILALLLMKDKYLKLKGKVIMDHIFSLKEETYIKLMLKN